MPFDAASSTALDARGDGAASSEEAPLAFENVLASACGECVPEYACDTSDGMASEADTLLDEAPEWPGVATLMLTAGEPSALLAAEMLLRGEALVLAVLCAPRRRGDCRARCAAPLPRACTLAAMVLTADCAARGVRTRGDIAGDTS